MNNYPTWIQPTHNTHCQAPGCATKHSALAAAMTPDSADAPVARVVTAGTDLCVWHHQQFPKVLADLVELRGDLVKAAYTKAKRPDQSKVASSGMQDVGAFWNPYAAAVLAEVTDWTRYLVHIILTERPLPETTIEEIHRPQVVWVAGERVVLENIELKVIEYSHALAVDDDPTLQLAAVQRHHAHWLSAYPFVGPYLLRDALLHRRNALKALDAEAVKQVQLQNGYCHEYIEDGPFGPLVCGAKLYAILRPGDDGKPSEVLCSTNPRHQQIPRDQWMEFMDAAIA